MRESVEKRAGFQRIFRMAAAGLSEGSSRERFADATGINLAIGRLRSVISISAPCSTARRSRESWLLNSAILIRFMA